MNAISRVCSVILTILGTYFHASASLLPKGKWEITLPDPITSFGACKSGGFLYVYSGHTGEAHVYSRETHSQSFVRVDLRNPKKWEELPFKEPLQGFGMVAHEGVIYLAGGSQATNDAGEKSNLRSLDNVSAFDTNTKKWTELTPLPGPRSSHELVVLDGKLYILGGWNMQNGHGVEWYDHGLVADLSSHPLKWSKLPKVKWRIRANSGAAVGGKLYAIGGLNDDGTSNKVRVFNPKNNKWSDGPDYPGQGRLKAFGSAACNLDGRLLACSFSSIPHILSSDGKKWEPAGPKLLERRFFHRMVPVSPNQVAFLGGADWEGHLNSIETFDISNGTGQKKLTPAKPLPSPPKGAGKGSTWRGFRGNGNSHTYAKGLPIEWSDNENVRWRISLHGYGQSTPVIWQEKVFTTATEGNHSENLLLFCHSLNDGKLIWKKTYPAPVKIERSKMVSQAAPSPVVDSKHVYIFFESGLLFATDHLGNDQWSRNLIDEYGTFEGNHGIGSSLIQSANHLGLLIDHSGPSYLLKIEKKTGETTWKIDRPERVSWSTPTYAYEGGKEYLYISSNGIVEAYDFTNGKQLWQLDGIEKNTVASPTITEKFVIVGSSEPKQSMALKRFGDFQGKDRIAWIAEDATSSFGSPLATDLCVYFVNRAGVVLCNDLKTGKKLWHKRIQGSCWASPTLADDKIYFFIKEGGAAVFKSDGTNNVLAENTLTIKSRIYGVAPVDGALIVRTGQELLCLSN